jgi:hypothetical protein
VVQADILQPGPARTDLPQYGSVDLQLSVVDLDDSRIRSSVVTDPGFGSESLLFTNVSKEFQNKVKYFKFKNSIIFFFSFQFSLLNRNGEIEK